jgi:hypothetical protein
MPILAWRTDADAFQFDNTWTFDSTEQTTLAGIAAGIAPLAIAQITALNPVIALDPGLLTILTAAASTAAATITATASLPTYGLCGGMAYISADFWLAKAPLPGGGNINDHPSRTVAGQSTLRAAIWNRLLDSLSPTGGNCLQTTVFWSLVLNQLPAQLGGGTGALFRWTENEWPKVKAAIDSGKPCPIGLLYANRDIWFQHQILVYGYELLPGGGTVRLHVYDSYFPHIFGDSADIPASDYLTFNLKGTALTATSPSDKFGPGLAGFFVTNYSPKAPPAGLDASFGRFVTWDGHTNFLTAYGATLRVANATELAALGGTSTTPRPATPPPLSSSARPRDGALLREHSVAPVFLYQGGAPFHVPNPAQLANFGGFTAVRVVPNKTIRVFAGFPADGTLIREFSDKGVFLCNQGALATSNTPSTSVDVRTVPDGAIRALLLEKISFGYSNLTVGDSCPTTVSLKLPFAGADTLVAVSSDQPAVATVPATVTISKGSTVSPTFNVVSTGAALAPGTSAIQITATVGEASVSGVLPLNPPGIVQFTLSPATVVAGQASVGTIVIAARYPAPITVNVTSSDSYYANVSVPVIILANATSTTFTVDTPTLNVPIVPATAQIQVSYGNSSASAVLTIQSSVVAGVVKSISLSPASVVSGGTSIATVTLMSAVGVATNVGLAAHPPNTGLLGTTSPLITSISPTTIPIAAGQTQGHATIHTKTIPANATLRSAVITAVAVTQVSATLTLI